ncbi:Aste57867_9843 [Aphanomyces stellatus]|uniref:Aste57867_9843 protein n=1 Tax=Aphanomyces stellatus TaxID=120398 RepID=A0A485KNX9_9STRA|nr:hypothetical protein As57867_009804 [Aphanomyces stellatus]VFT86722.1 Aste57867_9843 [Aphanomyces stellatus]
MNVPPVFLADVKADLKVDLFDDSHLPPILTETSKLFVPSSKSKAAKGGKICLTARERAKPELVMCRTKPTTFAPVVLQKFNHAQHERLREVLHVFETDTTHHCLRPVDRLFWYFELLDQLASTTSPVQALLEEVHRVLCEDVYDCTKMQHPQATRGMEYALLIKQVKHEHIDAELLQLQAALKRENAIEKAHSDELASLQAVLEKAKVTKRKMESMTQSEVAAQVDILRRDEDLYEHLLGDEKALERKASVHRLQLVECTGMRGQIRTKTHALTDNFRETMCLLHEKETEEKCDEAVESLYQELQREHAALMEKSETLVREIQTLEAQLVTDENVVIDKRDELKMAELDLIDVTESSADLQRSHTPRPKWDQVFKTLPEVSYADPDNQAPVVDPKTQRKKLRKQKGRTQVFVGEMCHWLQRIQGDCGMSLQLARLTNETEAARLELSTLQNQMETLHRRQKRQIQSLSPKKRMGLPSLAAVVKTVAAATKMLGGASAFADVAEPSSALQGKDFIATLGTSPEVPQFLRHTGRVRNRHMTKTELEKIIRTVWSGKKAKEVHLGVKIQLDEYLYEVLKTKFGIQTIIAEWGYNILQGTHAIVRTAVVLQCLVALKTYSWDSEVELFFLCLTGAVSETIHDDQELMLDECRHALHRLNDTYFDIALKREPKRVYLVQHRPCSFVALMVVNQNDMMLTLNNFFPMKTPLQLKSIERELLREAKSKETSAQGAAGETLIAIEELLPTKQKPTKGFFVKILRTQHFKEIQDYLALLDRKIRESDPHNTGRVEIHDIKAAMLAIDVGVTDTWLAECILRGIPKRLVGHVDMSSVVEYRIFFKKMNLKLMKHSHNFFPKANVVSLHMTPPTPWSPPPTAPRG